MGLHTKYLQKLKDEYILADIYTDHYDESDDGFIVDFNDDFLLIEKNPSLDRKFILLSLGDITRIDMNGQYENNLKRLFNEK